MKVKHHGQQTEESPPAMARMVGRSTGNMKLNLAQSPGDGLGGLEIKFGSNKSSTNDGACIVFIFSHLSN